VVFLMVCRSVHARIAPNSPCGKASLSLADIAPRPTDHNTKPAAANPAPQTKFQRAHPCNDQKPGAQATGFLCLREKARANELRKNISQYRDSKKYCCRLGN